MKYLHEYRDPEIAGDLIKAINACTDQPWNIMEVCGGQTHSIIKHGLDQLIPDSINLIHGPGCPVCVTPMAMIDKALAIAEQPDVIFCSFGDMLRVPGSRQDLLAVKAQGADVRIVYSSLDAVKLARENPQKHIVFFAVGFETTAPTTAMAVYQAQQTALPNFSMLVAHVRVPPVLCALLEAPGNTVQGFLAAGHVCAVMGYDEYLPIAQRYQTPIVVTGFEPVDILQGVLMCIKQLQAGSYQVQNQYRRVVSQAGNSLAQALIQQVFKVVNRSWRGLGEILDSGLALRPELAQWDAEQRFDLSTHYPEEPANCHSGEVLQGLLKPDQCPAFGQQCTPEHPLGATMVSSEGACAAYYRYRGQNHG